ncbi:uncharacterized protein HMPREF1541_03468 [Cyphellophora europaea CBS 101466]|uniref:Uncharacterized protein n=1 Tax=Cyphellophora europaea (strain CBS 101466) TaxID=1220924 RepID=W2RYK9_CYPE1|nr:uncharacterized protein HMPREF1541_03468 [Cyphellophora europaea CBS 101466]ETN41532.1 hypothetical protein HMPREF1541_03468 [Cyphellophora europaea CBS 101466]
MLSGINRPQSKEALDKLLTADSSVVILQTTDPKDAILVSAVTEKAAGSAVFGVVDKPEILGSKYMSPSLLCHKNGEDYAYNQVIEVSVNPKELSGQDIRNLANVELFVEDCVTPQIPEFGRRKMNHLYSLRKPIVYVFHDVPMSISRALNPLTKAWAGVVPFVHLDSKQHAEMVLALGLDPNGGFPAVTVEGVINDQVYPMPQDWAVEPENVDAFVGGILHGKATGGRKGMGWVQQAGLKGNHKGRDVKDEL